MIMLLGATVVVLMAVVIALAGEVDYYERLEEQRRKELGFFKTEEVKSNRLINSLNDEVDRLREVIRYYRPQN